MIDFKKFEKLVTKERVIENGIWSYPQSNRIGKPLEKSLNFWRITRNEVDYSPHPALDSPLKELASKAIYSAMSCLSEIENYLKKRGAIL